MNRKLRLLTLLFSLLGCGVEATQPNVKQNLMSQGHETGSGDPSHYGMRIDMIREALVNHEISAAFSGQLGDAPIESIHAQENLVTLVAAKVGAICLVEAQMKHVISETESGRWNVESFTINCSEE